jgi:ferredoxin
MAWLYLQGEEFPRHRECKFFYKRFGHVVFLSCQPVPTARLANRVTLLISQANHIGHAPPPHGMYFSCTPPPVGVCEPECPVDAIKPDTGRPRHHPASRAESSWLSISPCTRSCLPRALPHSITLRRR